VQESQQSIEKASFELLQELHEFGVQALNSLGGKQSSGLEQNYLVASTKHIWQIVFGYINIRGQKLQGLDYASKLLVRPVIESTFYLVATFRTPGFLLWKAKCEMKEEKKLLNPAEPAAQLQMKKIEDDIELLKQKLLERDSSYPINLLKPCTVRAAAEMADLEILYKYQYAIYCKYTHAALRAMAGGFDEMTSERDNGVLSWCLIVILDLFARKLPAVVPNLQPYYDRLSKLHGHPPTDSQS